MAKATPRRKSPAKAATSNVVAMPTAPARGHADVARRAYEIFLARGGEHRRDLEDWLLAELEVAERTAIHRVHGREALARSPRRRAI